VTGFCGHSNEPSGSIEVTGFDRQEEYCLIKKYSAPRSWFCDSRWRTWL